MAVPLPFQRTPHEARGRPAAAAAAAARGRGRGLSRLPQVLPSGLGAWRGPAAERRLLLLAVGCRPTTPPHWEASAPWTAAARRVSSFALDAPVSLTKLAKWPSSSCSSSWGEPSSTTFPSDMTTILS